MHLELLSFRKFRSCAIVCSTPIVKHAIIVSENGQKDNFGFLPDNEVGERLRDFCLQVRDLGA